MKIYIAKCDSGHGTCKFSEEEYFKWNGKCPYGKDNNIYCTARDRKSVV